MAETNSCNGIGGDECLFLSTFTFGNRKESDDSDDVKCTANPDCTLQSSGRQTVGDVALLTRSSKPFI
ncbi:hypothetical protein TYRP_014308 [Tyrophagus putrescentiae]|nr:hypothetical protein TYRP_014308 [Tyrophagus putrescentiae]